jgi:hypothetical protein
MALPEARLKGTNMLRKILSFGTVAGLIAGGMLSVIVVTTDHSSNAWGMVVGYLTMLVALSAIFVAIKRHRDVDLGGVIKFWPAFGLGLGISAIAGIFYVASWELAMAITQMDFAGDYSKSLIEQQKSQGVSGEALRKFVAEMDEFKIQYANPLFRLPMTFAEIFPVGVIVSLVSAGLLRKSSFLPARKN